MGKHSVLEFNSSVCVFVCVCVRSTCRLAIKNIIYPNDQIVAFKFCPVIIVLDPAFVFKDFSCNGSIQFIHIQVKVPAVLIDLCTAGRFSDGTPMVMILKPEKKMKNRQI